MENEKIVSYIEESFLKEILFKKDITDISFNGEYIFYMSNLTGRQITDIVITQEEVKDFLRQIANLSEKQFSYSKPILDVSAGKYRIHAINSSIGRYGGEPSVTFSIRISSDEPKIYDGGNFVPVQIESLINVLLRSKLSIVIGGMTGSGKTEFQKYLIRKIKSSRVIVIDNVLELEDTRCSELFDLNIWQANENQEDSTSEALVKSALRSNPDWIIVAESRGKEMLDTLNSAMTGHPIITTIHSLSSYSMPARMARLVLMNPNSGEMKNVLDDIYYHFHIHFYLKRDINKKGEIVRYIQNICYFDDYGKSYTIYEFHNGLHKFYPLQKSLISMLRIYKEDKTFIDTFIGENPHE